MSAQKTESSPYTLHHIQNNYVQIYVAVPVFGRAR